VEGVKRCVPAVALVLASFVIAAAAKTCSHHAFEIAVLRGRVSKTLLAKGVTQIEVLPESESQSKSLVFNPAVKRVVVANVDIDPQGRFQIAKLDPGLYWVVLAPSQYHFAVRIRKQAVRKVELQIDEENGCTIVDFLMLK
jgi:hypothetical protein